MKKKILIKNGIVIDPLLELQEKRDLYIQNGKIVEQKDLSGVDILVDAEGAYVFPGLIDYHSHIFYDNTEIGIEPDLHMLPQGVTLTVDAGSAGVANIQSLLDNVICRSKMRVKAFVNVCPSGLATMKFHENVDPKYWNKELLQEVLEKNKDTVLGLKVRISKDIVGDLGLDVLKLAVQLAESLQTRLVVHVTDPPENMGVIVDCLRSGDVLAHCYHGTGHTILDENKKVLEKVVAAQKRGVVIDAANGGNHWSFAVAEKALQQGFLPDIISTDITTKTVFKDPVFALPYIMSKYLMLGMDLMDVVARCTSIPAKVLGLESKLGSLQNGFEADAVVFKLVDKEISFTDTQGQNRIGKQVLVPQLTVCQGEIVYRSILL